MARAAWEYDDSWTSAWLLQPQIVRVCFSERAPRERTGAPYDGRTGLRQTNYSDLP